jgi:pSer/pThr/pTyr-binding forkhead associated (FHA) protein
MSKLVLFLPDGSTLDVPLVRERTTIGRRADNDICLPNLAVSGEHAVVVTILADSFLEDRNSTNGTRVNGNPVAKHFLRDRDEIEIGRHRLVYCTDDDANLKTAVPEGMARISARDFGERVEPAKPIVRGHKSRRPEAAPEGALADRDKLEAAPAPEPARRPQPASAREEATAVHAAPATPSPARTEPQSVSLKILSGIRAGAWAELTKPETTVGRPGVQVASIVNAGQAFRLKPLEGSAPPKVNGKPVDREGIELAHGDTIEVAATRLEFFDPRGGVGASGIAA